MNSNEVTEGPLTRYGYICQQLAAFVPQNSEASEETCFKTVYKACEQLAFKALEEIQKFLSDLRNECRQTIFYMFVKNGNLRVLTEILNNDILKSVLSDGKFSYLLHLAAKAGQSCHFIINCLKLDYCTLETRTDKGKIPVHYAIRYGHKHLIQLLLPSELDRGPIDTYFIKHNNLQLCPLSYAVAIGQTECVSLLLKTDKFSLLFTRIPSEGTLFHLCILRQRHAILKMFFSEYPNESKLLINERDDEGRTPLMLAAFKGDIVSIKLLIQMGARLNCQNRKKQTAIHLAALANQKSAIAELASKGAQLDERDKDNLSALDYCAAFGDLITNLKELQQKGKDVSNSFDLFEPENLVFAGAGIQSIAYAGVLKVFKDDKIKNLKRVAASSMGALIATLIAVNDDVHKTISETDFNAKFDHIISPTSIIEALKRIPSIAGIYALITTGQAFASLSPIAIVTRLLNIFNGFTGLYHGAEFLKWIEERIKSTTDIDNCTFGELAKRINSDPNTHFKHLHLFALKMGSTPQIVEFSSESREYEDLIISEAVRACIATLGIFKPHTPKFKDKDGQFYYEPSHVSYMDCGLVNNFPMQCFDQKGYIEPNVPAARRKQSEFNHKTLGFSLKLSNEELKSDSKIETTTHLAYSIYNLFYNIERAMRGKISEDSRVIDLDFTGVKYPKIMEFDQALIDKSLQTVESNLRLELSKRFVDINLAPEIIPINLNKLRLMTFIHKTMFAVLSRGFKEPLVPLIMLKDVNKTIRKYKFRWTIQGEPRFQIFHLIHKQRKSAEDLLDKERKFFEVNFQSEQFLEALIASDQPEYLNFFKLLINVNQSKNYKKILYKNAIKHQAFDSLITLIKHSEEVEQPLLTNGQQSSGINEQRQLDDEGGTLLHLIVQEGDVVMYDQLAQATNREENVLDSYLNIPNHKGETPVLTALKNKKYLMAHRLLENEKTDLCVIDRDTQKSLLTIILTTSELEFRDKKTLVLILLARWTPSQKIAMAEKENAGQQISLFDIPDPEMVSLLITHGFYLKQRDKNQKTYCYFLAENNALKELKIFCESFRKHHPSSYLGFLEAPVIDNEGIGKTALMVAIEKTNFAIVDYLFNEMVSTHEANHNNTNATEIVTPNQKVSQILEDDFCERAGPSTHKTIFALTQCSEYKLFDLAKRIIHNITSINTEIKNLNDEGLLLIVLKSHHFNEEQKKELVMQLIKKGDDINQKDQQGKTPLHYAAETNLEVVQLLIQDREINPNQKDLLGNTALHYSVMKNQIQITQMLLQDLRLNVNITNNQRRTALHITRDPESAECLIKRGADPSLKDVNGYTAVQYASPLADKRLKAVLSQASKK